MQKAILTLIILLLCPPVFAQEDSAPQKGITHYIFNDFLTGTVRRKSGQLIDMQLNYNTLTEEMIFIRDTQKLAIANLEDIDTVYLGGKVFVPAGKVFYEKATNTPVALYVQHKTNLLPPGSSLGYGITTESGAVSSVSSVVANNQVYKLQLPSGYKLVPHTTYWVNKDDGYIKVSVKKLQAVFPAKATVIRDYVKANNINLDSQADIIKLVVFCNEP